MVFRSLCIIALAGLAYAPAHAAGTHLFASEANARDVCGQDKVVWAYLDTPEYFRKGMPDYAKGKGAYTCEKSARSRGWHVVQEHQTQPAPAQ